MSGRDADDELPADADDDGAVPSEDAAPNGDGVGDGIDDDAAGEESEWRFSVDDVGPDGVTEDTATPETEPIEPGDISLEHAALVVLGVAITVAVLLFGF